MERSWSWSKEPGEDQRTHVPVGKLGPRSTLLAERLLGIEDLRHVVAIRAQSSQLSCSGHVLNFFCGFDFFGIIFE